MRKECSSRMAPESIRRPANALNIEIGTPMERCLLKLPDGWTEKGLTASRWLLSGGDCLIFGICSSNCPKDAKE
jgi:hypothetical protein